MIKQIDNRLFKCEIYLKKCELYKILKSDLVKLLEGELEINNIKYQFIGNNLDLRSLNTKSNYLSKKFLNSTIFYEKGIELKIDEENNVLIVNQLEVGARAFLL